MARKSRKGHGQVSSVQDTVYIAGGYCRLSEEDKRHPERHTLVNQKNVICDFVDAQSQIHLHSFYTDDGQSGTNFERPGFKSLLADVRNGTINCIIVKDLSRFARDFREAGRYLEEIFPSLGVRFISINDHYDTAQLHLGSEGISIPITNLVNELYARDISRKVNTSLAVKRQAGEYLGSRPPYGYQKSTGDKHKLIPDAPAANVVKTIFEWLGAGWSPSQVAHQLNSQGICAPGRYFYDRGILSADKFRNSTTWYPSTIRHIATNPVYMGDMAQGKRDGSYFSKKPGPCLPSQWVVVQGTHQPLVGPQLFAEIQQRLER